MSEQIKVLSLLENEDDSLTVELELSEEMHQRLLEIGFNAILEDQLTRMEEENERNDK